MLLTDQSNIRDVILFPAMRALPGSARGTNAQGDAAV
jgi:aspartyl-tRNA synthetase